ncbi:MAG: DUF6198 family protein [Eubacteriales bacterium]|nr:DUF6198 family protein [Eubacteriales bacterium]
MKKTFSTEAAYLFGIILLAVGTAILERADFGMSMVVAPAYILHLKISETFSFFSFGMAEYTMQAILIVILSLIQRRFHRSYLFSFFTAVFYGILLDISIVLLSLIPSETLFFRIILYVIGIPTCSAGVSLLFHTYISPEAYELFVKVLSAKYNIPISKFKTLYDCSSCVLSILLSFAFWGFGHFEGVKAGTVLIALINGWTIGLFSNFFERRFDFRDSLSLRKYFE